MAPAARIAPGIPAPRPTMRLRLLLPLAAAGVGVDVGVGVEVMIEIIVVAMPSELDVIADEVTVVGVAFGVADVGVEVVIELLVVELVDEVELDEVEDRVTDDGGAVLEMKPISLAELRSRTSASSLSQQLFFGSRLLSQHHESSGQCWIASLPAAVLSALR